MFRRFIHVSSRNFTFSQNVIFLDFVIISWNFMKFMKYSEDFNEIHWISWISWTVLKISSWISWIPWSIRKIIVNFHEIHELYNHFVNFTKFSEVSLSAWSIVSSHVVLPVSISKSNQEAHYQLQPGHAQKIQRSGQQSSWWSLMVKIGQTCQEKKTVSQNQQGEVVLTIV